jgi:type VI secretion system secreted protein VgrG
MLAVQENINLTISTPLGKDKLIIDKFDGIEYISDCFCFSLDMHSTAPDLDLSALVGKEVQITFKYGTGKRHFCGIVGTAEQGWTVKEGDNNFTYYTAKIYPKLWLLKFTRDHRIFQNKSAMDIIKAILSENGVTEIDDKTSKCGQRVRKYCVQYAESCFDFISRLMEEEGVFYYFVHSDSKHTMVMADVSKDSKDVSPSDVEFMKVASEQPQFNLLYDIKNQEQVVVKKFSAADFNFKTPTTKLHNKVSGEGEGGEVYTYPGLFMKSDEGDLIANHRIEQLEWAKILLSGRSSVPTFCPMFSYKMKEHPRSDLNDKYILYRVHHRINQNAVVSSGQYIYENEFVSFPSDVPFRPPMVTPKPRIHSTQTAIVTTKSGEEIWCDEFGRIKVHFHWDQRGSKDEKSSCWIRCAQLWAGNNWGGLWTPRIGMEVVVTFLDGDPDRPLITGCVYNGQNASPYSKSEPTKSTIKSNSTKGGGGDNEFRFEDKKGSEQIFLHAQKDWDSVVEHSRTLMINTGDDTSTIKKGQRTVTLNGGDTGHDTLTLDKGNRSVTLSGSGTTNKLTITNGDNIITITKGNQNVTLGGGNMTITVTGNVNLTATGNVAMTATGNMNLTSTGMTNVTSTAPMTLQSSAMVTVNATAMLNLIGAAGVNMTSPGPISIASGAAVSIVAPSVAIV